jgi:hypothetical protein
MSWWFNRTGAIAQATAQQGNVPDYGLTLDLGVAPWDEDDSDFQALADAIEQLNSHETEDKTLWDWAKVGASWAGSQAAGVIGALDVGASKIGMDATEGGQLDKLEAEANRRGLTGWDRMQFIGGADIGNTMTELTEDPATGTALEVLDLGNEYAASTFLTATMAEDAILPSGQDWRAARRLQQEGQWNAGQAFMAMFLDKETVTDEERIRKIREHSTAFNVGALGFNLIAGWKYDPTVLVGKGAGVVRDASRGALARKGTAAKVQRQVLTAGLTGGREAAEAVARNQGGLYARTQGHYGLSLYDRALNLREAAKTMGAEEFLSRPEFSRSTNGPIMAQLFREVAHSDKKFELVFRTAIGDGDALEQLRGMGGEVTDKLNAIEMADLPAARGTLDSALADYDVLRKERGESVAQMRFIEPQDFFAAPNREAAVQRLADMEARFQSYSTANDWLTRAVRGFDDSREAGAIFNALDAVGPSDFSRGIRAKVSTWQHDHFSPKVRVIQLPKKAALRRVGSVALHDPNDGVMGLQASLNQLDHVTGKSSQGFRDRMFEEFASASTDVSRRNVLGEAHHVGWAALGQKYGLDPDGMAQLGKLIEQRRGQVWAEMTAPKWWRRLTGENRGRSVLPFMDEDGALNYMAGDPMDVSQLQNHFPMINWIDLDHTIRMNRDLLNEVVGNETGAIRRGTLKTARGLENAYNGLGTVFNTFWKPLALFSIRWPLRVLGDEGYRTTHVVGALPYLTQVGRTLGHTVYNTGTQGVRAYEWFRGRKVRTGSPNRESLRTDQPMADPYDHRTQQAVPVEEWGVNEVNQKRYDGLNSAVSRRRIEGTVDRNPRWAQQWNDRLAAAEQGGSRGFFFDPVSGRAASKGHAVSVYPGRLRTFERKPTAMEMNDWIEANGDVLSIPRNRVSVWLDKETGRWHLDVHRVFRQREDALYAAGKSGVDELYDIGGGFTRYMDREDPYQHYSSPLVTGEGAAQATPPAAPALEIRGPKKKRIGFGEKVLKAPDGERLVRPDVYGTDPDDPNIWFATNSSSEMARALYRGHTFVTGQKRHGGGQRATYQPGEPDTLEAKEWAEAWAQYINKHIRNSPIWLRMLNGQTDEQVARWLKSSEGRTQVRERLGKVTANPDAYVDEMRAMFDDLLPTGSARSTAAQREVKPDEVDDLIPFEQRSTIDAGGFLKLDSDDAGWLRRKVDKTYQWLAAMPNDKFVRHPMAALLFNSRRANYIASLPPGTKVTNGILNAAEAEARAFANQQIKRTLYNIADESQGVYMLRYLAPFAQAQYEVINRYLRLFTERPESFARTFLMFHGSNTMDNGLFYVTDREGNEAEGFDNDNVVHVKVKPWHRKALGLFGFDEAMKYQEEFKVPVASLNLILQGNFDPLTGFREGDVSRVDAVTPGLGPFVSMPANEFFYKNRQELTEKGLGKYLFPFGVPQGDFGDRVSGATAPAWLKRLETALSADMDDRGFYQTVAYHMDNQWYDIQTGERDKPVSVKEAEKAAKDFYILRAMASFAMPFPIQGQPTNQFYIDRYREIREKDPENADELFLAEYGPEFFAFTQETSRSANGLSPTIPAMKAYKKHKALIDKAPELAGLIVGPYANGGEFSGAVYNWAFNTEMGPGMGNMRTLPDISGRVASTETSLGWIEYGKLANAITVELRARQKQGLPGTLGANANADLALLKKQGVRLIADQHQGWQQSYLDRSSSLPKFLSGAYATMFDKSLNGRADIEAMRGYLATREKFQAALIQRQMVAASSGRTWSSSLSFNEEGVPTGDNEDLGVAWRSYVNELAASNLFFAEIYNRYLEADDLSVFVEGGV